MNKDNNVKASKVGDETYLGQLEEMNYPVIKYSVLTQEEFNEELRAGYCEAVPVKEQTNLYLEAIEDMGYPVIKVTQVSQEEFNELLKDGYLTDSDIEYKTLNVKRLLDKKVLAMVS